MGTSGEEEATRKVIGALQRTLTDLQALQLGTKQAHWNVVGTLFYPLHELLQEHYEAVAKHADSVAERLPAIGVSSDGRVSTIVRGSTLPEIPGGYLHDAQVIRWFICAYKAVGEALQQSIADTAALRRYLRDPSSVRRWPDQKMPGFTPRQLGDTELDAVIEYLAHMAQRRPE